MVSLPAFPNARWVGIVDVGGEHGGPHIAAIDDEGFTWRWVGWGEGGRRWQSPALGGAVHMAAVAAMARGITARDAEIAQLTAEVERLTRALVLRGD